MLLVKKLTGKPYSTFKELQDYVNHDLEYFQILDDTLIIGFLKCTLQRDIREIANIFGLKVEYSKTNKGHATRALLSELTIVSAGIWVISP